MDHLKILLIEDNQTIAEQLCEFLGAHKWVVDYAHNGQLGIRLASDNIYEVLLLDLNLPDLDGLAVCQQLKQVAAYCSSALMLTARDAYEDKVKGYQQGADDYVTKPWLKDMRYIAKNSEGLQQGIATNARYSIGL